MKIRRWMLTLLLFSTVGAVGCELTGGHNLPPAAQLAHPGPGVGGPGPGVLAPPMPPIAQVSAMETMGGGGGYGGAEYGGTVYESGGMTTGVSCMDGSGGATMAQPVQVLFGRPEGMQVQWDVGGVGQFDSAPLITPGRQNFQQGGIYRLKLTNIPGAGREGVELYPTLEIGPPAYRTLAYLAHNAIPVQFTEEDFDQVLAGNFVTKVIYLPDPEFQGLAVADVQTLVSTRLDPGLDPIEEASRKGAILAVIRIGNKDMEIPGVDSGSIIPASYVTGGPGGAVYGDAGCPSGNCLGGNGFGGPCFGGACQIGGNPQATMQMPPGGMPPGLVSGMNMPQYGMPMSGTPIGLPGPPHIPLGVPAGLKRHVIHNHTKMHIPDPVNTVKINVKQRPGQSYPQPASRAWITEDTIHPGVHFSHHHFGQPSDGQVQYNCGPDCFGTQAAPY